MKAIARADFKYDVVVDNRVHLTLREICPRDFYWFSLVENDFPDLSSTLSSLLILVMLLDLDEESELIRLIPCRCIAPLTDWMMKELINEKVMKVDQWLEIAFHLCKQRWDDTVEWLETQPMSKIMLMSQVVTKFVAEQNREMKKASKKK